jgi:hypothetical protein
LFSGWVLISMFHRNLKALLILSDKGRARLIRLNFLGIFKIAVRVNAQCEEPERLWFCLL